MKCASLLEPQLFSSLPLCSSPGIGLAGDPVKVKFDDLTREYCHVLRFPVGWPLPMFRMDKDGHREYDNHSFGLADNYGFRVPGLPQSSLLIRGVDILDSFYNIYFYTPNVYKADLSEPQGVAQPASEEEWNAATPIPFK